jgi:signal peptidase I
MDSEDLSQPPTQASAASGKVAKNGLAETTRFLVLLFVLALLLRSLIVAPFNIPSGSMLPRMMIGDYLFVAKWPYGYSRYSFPFGLISFDGRIVSGAPERGDVVVFRAPAGDKDMVKRVIGLPGDMVQMRSGTLYLNGEAVPKVRVADYLVPISPNSSCRPFTGSATRDVAGPQGERLCAYPRYRETLPGGRSYEVLDQRMSPGDETPIFLVPEGHYFMMGDNRDDSADSRFPQEEDGVGMLPEDQLIGRALITFFSTDGSAEWIKPWTWFSAARWDRIGGTY